MIRKISLTFLFSLLLPSLLWGAVTISVSPTSDQILPGSVRSVYSNVQGATALNVTWTVSGGTVQESTGYFVRWKAPSTPGTYTITARSVEDNAKTAIATFTVISDAVVKVSNIPAQVTAYKNQPVAIQSILWGSTNTAVTWTSSGGTLTGNGREVVFTASTSGTYTVTATSSANSSKTATTTIVVTNNPYPATATPNKTQPVDCTATGSGNTYEVTSEATMDSVPWSSLGAGDTVRIHAGTYHKQILISTSGTESQPIRICGVPDGSGNLPELNGANATAKAGSDYNSGYTLQGYGGILIYDNTLPAPYVGQTYPKNIIIEGLKLTGFKRGNTFVNIYTGNPQNYAHGVAPIRLQHGGNVTVRGNELTDNDNGLFTMSNNGAENKATRNFLVEGNYIHNNGVVGSYLEHQSYIQAFGLVVQGNYYDSNRSGCLGGQLKTRSVQQFIRYNYFEPAARILDLVEVQDSYQLVLPWFTPEDPTYTTTADVVANYEAYQDKHVYGNIIHNVGPASAAWVLHGAADNGQDGNSGGVLYFYHNTVMFSSVNGETSNWRYGLADFGPGYTEITDRTIWPTGRFTNNAIYIRSPAPGTPSFFWNRYMPDRVVLDKNWISTGWGSGNSAGGDDTGIGLGITGYPWQGGTVATQVSGISNLITSSTIPFNTTTYMPTPGGPLINASTSLPTETSSLPPLINYNLLTHCMSRRTTFKDIGALEYIGTTAPEIIKIQAAP